jgi:membrane protein required for colicin V production
MRGFVREILSLAGWVIAFMIAGSFANQFEPMLPSSVTGESLRILIAFVVVFISVLLVMMLVTMLLSSAIKSVGLGFIDRLFGSFFGFLRGFVVVMILVLIAGLTGLPKQPFWQQALLNRPLETAAMEVVAWLPIEISQRINFENDEE